MNSTSALESLGGIVASSFVIVAVGDLIAGIGNLIVTNLIAPSKAPWAQKVVFYWGLIDDAWDEIRGFLNRISAYSHDRPAYSRGKHERNAQTDDKK